MVRARAILTVLTLCVVGAGVCFAQGAFIGTWKLKETKSEFSPGAPKNSTVVYEAEGWFRQLRGLVCLPTFADRQAALQS
jgi:hypothetical protein